MNEIVHFHSSDERFCGNRKNAFRRFSLDPNEVTCPVCKDNDTLVLSNQGEAYVKSLNQQPTNEEIRKAIQVLAGCRNSDGWLRNQEKVTLAAAEEILESILHFPNPK